MAEAFINNRYRILKKLGEGGMGAVYMVEDAHRQNQLLALKTLKANVVDSQMLKFLRNEFTILTKLRHLHVASSFDFGKVEETGEHFFTSEFVKGTGLLEGTKDLTVDERIEVMVQVCRALEYIHSRGLVHHDLKPENILLTEPRPVEGAEGEGPDPVQDLARLFRPEAPKERLVKVIDFGLIDRERVTHEKIMGSPHYIPPEKIAGEPTDRRSDLYSFGVILYLIFTRRFPFRGQTVLDILKEHQSKIPAPPRLHNPDLPAVVEKIILKLLEKSPAKRYQTAAEVIREVNDGLGRGFTVETEVSKKGYIESGSFVGREEEFGILVDHFRTLRERPDDLASPGPRAFILAGEGGTGKSRLLEEFKYHVQLNAEPWIAVVSPEPGEALPRPIEQLLRQVLPLLGPKGAEDRNFLELTRLLAPVEGEKVPPDLTARVVAAACGLLERAASGRAVALGWERLEKLDELSRALYFEILSRTQPGPRRLPIFLTATLRENPAEATEIQEALKSKRVNREIGWIPLANLNPAQMKYLLTTMFGTPQIPEPFFKKLLTFSRGNPLFIVEILKSIAEQGFITKAGTAWVFSPEIDKAPFPERLSDILIMRVAALDPPGRDFLNLLAVFQGPVSEPLLTKAFGTDTVRVSRRLLDRQLIRVEEEEQREERSHQAVTVRQRWYRFYQDRLRDTLYERIPPDDRRRYHEMIAALLDAHYGKDARAHLLELAHHYLLAGNAPRGLPLGFSAGEHLRKLHDNQGAVRYYELVRSVAPPKDIGSRIKANGRLCELFELIGKNDQGLECLKDILAVGGPFLNPKAKGGVFRKMSQLRFHDDRPEEALVFADQAVATLAAEKNLLDLAAVRGLKTLVLLRLGRADEARKEAMETEALLRSVPPDPKVEQESIPIHNTLGIAAYLRGDYEAAREFFGRNEVLCRRFNQEQGVGATLTNLALIEDEVGRFDRAEALYKDAAEFLRRIADNKSLAKALQGLALLRVREARTEGTIEICREAITLSEETGDKSVKARSLRALGALSLLFGKYASALAFLSEAARICGEVHDRAGAALAAAGLAEAEIAVGRFEAAARSVQLALREALASGQGFVQGKAELSGALAALARRDAYGAAEHFNRAEGIFRRGPNPRELFELYLRRSHFLLEQEDLQGADLFLGKIEALGRPGEGGEGLKAVPADLEVERLLVRGKRAVAGGRPAEGLALLDQALARAQGSRLMGLEWKIESALAWAAGLLGDADLAKRKAEAARLSLQSASEGLSDEDRSGIRNAPDVRHSLTQVPVAGPPPEPPNPPAAPPSP